MPPLSCDTSIVASPTRHVTDRVYSTLTQQQSLDQKRVSVTTEDVLGCLSSDRSTLALQAEEVWLSLRYVVETNNSSYMHTPSTCWMQVRGGSNGVMSLLIFNVTCSTPNRLVVHSQMWNRHSFDCDPTAWSAPGMELTMTSDLVNISIEINDASTPFSLHALFKVFESRGLDKMEVRHVTDYLGTSIFIYVLCR